MRELCHAREVTLAHGHNFVAKPAFKAAHQMAESCGAVLDKPVMQLDDHMAASKGLDHAVCQKVEFSPLDIDQHNRRSGLACQQTSKLARICFAQNFNLVSNAIELCSPGDAAPPLRLDLETIGFAEIPLADSCHAKIAIGGTDIDEDVDITRQGHDALGDLLFIKSEQLCADVIVVLVLPALELESGEGTIGDSAFEQVEITPCLGNLYGLDVFQPPEAAKMAT